MSVQYITDQQGKKQSVIISYEAWMALKELLNTDLQTVSQNSNDILNELITALKQVQLIRQGKLPRKTLQELLDED